MSEKAFCGEHTHLVENQGKMLALLEVGNRTMTRLDKRINGAFETISVHMSEGDIYRAKIITLEVMAKQWEKNKDKKEIIAIRKTGVTVGVIMGLITILSSWGIVIFLNRG